MIKGKDISEPVFSEKDRECGRKGTGDEIPLEGLAQLAQLFLTALAHRGALRDESDNNTVLNSKEFNS